MGSEFSPEKIEQLKVKAGKEIKEVLDGLRDDAPKAYEGVAAATGGALGYGASFAALFYGGTTVGLSAAGITSGLGASGRYRRRWKAAGVGVLAPPVAIGAVAFYAIAKKRRKAKEAAAIARAIEELYATQERLMANAEYFRRQLAVLEVIIEELEKEKRLGGGGTGMVSVS